MEQALSDILANNIAGFKHENFDDLIAIPVQNRVANLAKMLNCTDEKEAVVFLSKNLEIPYVNNFTVNGDYLQKLPAEFFTSHGILPIKDVTGANKLCMITCWPIERKVCKQIEVFCGEYPEIFLGLPVDIMTEMSMYFGFNEQDENVIEAKNPEEPEENESENEAEVVKFVNDIIRRALKSRATDIHFEPQRNSLKIRYRIDGDLVAVRVPENLVKFQAAIISRLKIMAELNISEKRRPQDGKISFRDGKTNVDIRVSTLPVVYGESISLRLLLQGGSAPVSLRDLDMTEEQYNTSNKALNKPHGIILVTGPTGSGKSTTLGSFLRHVYTPTIRLLTVEDPVEFEIPGANQSQVHSEIGLTFASVLRSILRQDPDVIMLGEIRDSETGDIAVRAAITGHLVLSTLHTNDAVGSITRLKDIGIPYYMIASALELVCAQRLVKRLCPHCAVRSDKLNSPSEVERLSELFGMEKLLTDTNFMEPVGCEHCNGLGYRSRMAVFEVLGMHEKIHEAIVTNATETEIRKIAVDNGMIFLAQDALARASRGLTSVEEAISLIP